MEPEAKKPSETKASLISQRGGVRGQITLLLKQIDPIRKGTTAYNEWQLTKVVQKLEGYYNRLVDLDDRISSVIDNTAEQDSHNQQAISFNDSLMDHILEIRKMILDNTALTSTPQVAGETSSSSSGNLKGNFKLPKFEMSIFTGDPMKWRGWWDIYKRAIHDNVAMSSVEKFSYLVGYLGGEALAIADGYELSEANYSQVISELTERFGDKQRAQFAHFEALFSIEKAKNRSLSEVQRVADQCERHIRSLIALDLDEETFCVCFIPLLLKKLPTYLATDICLKNGASKWSMAKIRQWIKDDIRAREVSEASFGGMNGKTPSEDSKPKDGRSQNFKPNQIKEAKFSTTSSLAAPLNAQAGRKPFKFCPFCQNSSHFSDECNRYRDADSRRQALLNLSPRVCFYCFDANCFEKRNCKKAKTPCRFCQKLGHHQSLCYSQFPNRQFGGSKGQPTRSEQVGKQWQPKKPTMSNLIPEKRDTPRKENTSVNVAVAHGSEAEYRDFALLPTAVVNVRDESGRRKATARALTDSASSRTYITERLSRQLGLENVGSTYLSVGKFGTNRRSTVVSKRVRFQIVCVDGTLQTVLAHVTPVISCPVSRCPIDVNEYPEVRNLRLGEPLSSRPDHLELDILIGSDQFWNFVLPNDTIDTCKGLVLVGSRLGYLTAGTMPVVCDEYMSENTLVLLLTESESLDLERFWRLEEVGAVDKKSVQLTEDEEALGQFRESVKFEDGRYQVKWPWRTPDPDLPDNYGLALSRLQSTWKRLKKEELLQAYDDIIQSQIDNGIVELCVKQSGRIYYLPHHPVITPQKTTTKIRIVNDASSKSSKEANSLNDCLLRGQVMVDDLCGSLLRFRLHRVGLVSDIEKAFLQVGLQESERDVGRFLWLKNIFAPPTSDNLVTYRFTRVFFGANSSPFLLGATIDHHLRLANSPVAEKIRTNIYVDNVITGEDSVQQAINHYRESKNLFLGASMNLREFFTNSEAVRKEMAPKDRGTNDETKVLGLTWNCTKDTLACSALKPVKSCGTTKRQILKQAAQVFDPCGFFTPVVLPSKLIIQTLWRLDLAWDQQVPSDIVRQWLKARAELEKISTHAIKRYIGNPEAELELHVFCDASQSAAGAVVYLRKIDSSSIVCDLLMAKSRLAPLKPAHTIPRLELVGVSMGVSLVEFVDYHLRLSISRKVVWTDSQCVLSWLEKEKLPGRFVENRIKPLRQKIGLEFRYVPTGDNPADLCSRGCGLDTLVGKKVWWHGPFWLKQTEEKWPANRNPRNQEEPIERVSQLALVTTSQTVRSRIAVTDPQRVSSLSKLLRVTSFVLRFIHNAGCSGDQRRVGCLTIQELASARKYWEKLAQEQGFPGLSKEISVQVLRKTPLAQLNVFRGTDGLLHCDTRLDKSGLPYDALRPILLPKNHPITDLVIRDAHCQTLHAGIAQTLATVRQRYWVIHGRNQVRRVIRSCTRCRRIEGGPFGIPAVPNLPQFRVTQQVPFETTGLDYFGFLTIRVAPNQFVKVWVCLFTCAVTRAVHLELVEDQSSDEFHLALRRFLATQGQPKLIVSDNASQFVAVETAMKKLWNEIVKSDKLRDDLAMRDIEWKKIPQMSPWMGGFYERLVGLVKKFLKKSLDGRCVSFSELRTVLTEIQTIVNSRPLLYVDDGVTSMQLCPADLLGKARSRSLTVIEESETGTEPRSTINKIMSSWKRLQAITTNYWNMWRDGYLSSLREYSVKLKQRNPSELRPKIGTVVQVKDKLPRAQWRLGKIVELHLSKDGKTRSVTLNLSNGRKIVRPIKLLYPLECQSEFSDSSEQGESMTGSIPHMGQVFSQGEGMTGSSPSGITQTSAEVDGVGLPRAVESAEEEDEFSGFESEDIDSVENQIREVDKLIEKAQTNKSAVSVRPKRIAKTRARENIRQNAEETSE